MWIEETIEGLKLEGLEGKLVSLIFILEENGEFQAREWQDENGFSQAEDAFWKRDMIGSGKPV